jgi:hypothetical protein
MWIKDMPVRSAIWGVPRVSEMSFVPQFDRELLVFMSCQQFPRDRVWFLLDWKTGQHVGNPFGTRSELVRLGGRVFPTSCSNWTGPTLNSAIWRMKCASEAGRFMVWTNRNRSVVKCSHQISRGKRHDEFLNRTCLYSAVIDIIMDFESQFIPEDCLP